MASLNTVIRMDAMTAAAPKPDWSSSPEHADLIRTCLDQLAAAGHRSTAELLHELRQQFPDAPLAVRVRALAALSRR
jgi:hypothetical protein